MEAFAGRCVTVLRQLLGAALLALIVLTLLQVTLRYLFHHSLEWVEEISVVILTWLAWAGAAMLWLQQTMPPQAPAGNSNAMGESRMAQAFARAFALPPEIIAGAREMMGAGR